MPIPKNADITDGALAYREYELTLRDGSAGTIVFTLGSLARDSPPAAFAREHNALAYGLSAILNVPNAPLHPFLWMHDSFDLSVVALDQGPPLSLELQELVTVYIRHFFKQ